MTGSPDPGRAAWVSLGSNVGDRAAVMRDALRALRSLPDTQVTAVSSLYRTPPWGDPDQDDFLNAVVRLDTGLAAGPLLAALLAIEDRLGRRRDPGRRWGPRTIDLDLLLHGEAPHAAPGLRVPHPRLHERAFVLVPLVELDPDVVVPGRGRAADLLGSLDDSGIERLRPRAWPDA